jgi:hypothetical protein
MISRFFKRLNGYKGCGFPLPSGCALIEYGIVSGL